MILEVKDVTVRYRVGDFKGIGLKEHVLRRLKGQYKVEDFFAVDGVSFTLDKGDLLGIIGTNGAGKSTLLKTIAGIMVPSRGYIKANGTIAALLELSSGFDNDLSVKENAYLRGALLGYTREFMNENIENILAFAELGDFRDRAYKHLSTGMQSRLAFSIAAWVNPDILILDEVLSVGDGAFREKSEQKMREIIGRGNATILVSHSLQQIRQMCSKVLWIDKGRTVAFGETAKICEMYEEYLSSL